MQVRFEYSSCWGIKSVFVILSTQADQAERREQELPKSFDEQLEGALLESCALVTTKVHDERLWVEALMLPVADKMIRKSRIMGPSGSMPDQNDSLDRTQHAFLYGGRQLKLK